MSESVASSLRRRVRPTSRPLPALLVSHALVALASCGQASSADDPRGVAGSTNGGGSGVAGSVNAAEPQLEPSAPAELPLLEGLQPDLAFQHSAEVTVAAYQGTVVLASINLHHDSADTLTAGNLRRRVTLVVSRDGGRSFEAPFAPAGSDAETSDPVVRVASSGVFWLSAIGVEANRTHGILWRSQDRAVTWQLVQEDLSAYDKEWLAIAPDGRVYLGANGGFWKFDQAGKVESSWLAAPDWPISGGFADEQAVYFGLINGLATTLIRWTGEPQFEQVTNLDHGVDAWSVPVGRAAGGDFWAVAPFQAQDDTKASVSLRVFSESGAVDAQVQLSDPAAHAFLPAAALDSAGRLHAIWYESAETTGVLKYARSISAILEEGFEAPRVVDPLACPSGHWFPTFGDSLEAGNTDRRLREYVDVAVDEQRVHLAWTRGGSLPTRISASFMDF